MKYKIPQDRLDKIIFKYLDLNLNGLEKRKSKYYKGIVLVYPDKKYGILGWENDGTLYVYYEIIEEISSIFPLKKTETKKLIGRWVSDRFQLEVINTAHDVHRYDYLLLIDSN